MKFLIVFIAICSIAISSTEASKMDEVNSLILEIKEIMGRQTPESLKRFTESARENFIRMTTLVQPFMNAEPDEATIDQLIVELKEFKNLAEAALQGTKRRFNPKIVWNV